ncbi:MAG: SIS domain-containing protein [Kangiellaceae bacterium]|jgi:DnaA initiator-associating protein|nr:SIS domain-containing protein [Kangiellaceae bacterium]
MLENIKLRFTESIQTKIDAADTLPVAISEAGALMTQALVSGKKILCCGNGGSASLSQHFAASMINRFERERPSLPVISLASDTTVLTNISNDAGSKEIFVKQIRALGQAGDILVVLSAHGDSKNITKAIESALARDMLIVALTSNDSENIAGLIGSNDVEISVPSSSPARVLELHLLIIHCLCDFIDNSLFGEVS